MLPTTKPDTMFVSEPTDAITRRDVAAGGLTALVLALLAGWAPRTASAASEAPCEAFEVIGMVTPHRDVTHIDYIRTVIAPDAAGRWTVRTNTSLWNGDGWDEVVGTPTPWPAAISPAQFRAALGALVTATTAADAAAKG